MHNILIARIIGPHGLRGQVKLKNLSEDLRRYASLRTADGRELDIAKIVPAKDHLIVTFKSVTDRNAAESLKGTDLFISTTQLPPSTEEIYLATLIGREVLCDGKMIGKIAGYQNFGAGELMELDTGVLIPMRFMIEARDAVTVDLPPGFLDPAESQS